MFRFYFSIFLLLLQMPVFGQVVDGIVSDNVGGQPVAGVSVTNRRTGVTVGTDRQGLYVIDATDEDVLVFRHVAYRTYYKTLFHGDNSCKRITLEPATYKLRDATVSRTKYQQDSIARHEIYGHELTRPLVPKPKFYGIACVGCFGWLADKITGNSKPAKRFRAKFASEDEMKFIDTRYTFDVVTAMTGIRDTDSMVTFINAYPMDYGFARNASSLEIKAWIRNNYKEYRKQFFVKKE